MRTFHLPHLVHVFLVLFFQTDLTNLLICILTEAMFFNVCIPSSTTLVIIISSVPLPVFCILTTPLFYPRYCSVGQHLCERWAKTVLTEKWSDSVSWQLTMSQSTAHFFFFFFFLGGGGGEKGSA